MVSFQSAGSSMQRSGNLLTTSQWPGERGLVIGRGEWQISIVLIVNILTVYNFIYQCQGNYEAGIWVKVAIDNK